MQVIDANSPVFTFGCFLCASSSSITGCLNECTSIWKGINNSLLMNKNEQALHSYMWSSSWENLFPTHRLSNGRVFSIYLLCSLSRIASAMRLPGRAYTPQTWPHEWAWPCLVCLYLPWSLELQPILAQPCPDRISTYALWHCCQGNMQFSYRLSDAKWQLLGRQKQKLEMPTQVRRGYISGSQSTCCHIRQLIMCLIWTINRESI